MVVYLIQVFSNLGKSSVFCNLHLNWNLHVDLRVDAYFDPSIYLHYSSSSQYHLSPNFASYFFSTQITYTYTPVLLSLPKSVPHVFEVSRRHHQHLLIGQINQLSISSDYLVLLLEFLNVCIEFLLKIEVIGYLLVGI